jgi:hypothetical protein
MPLFTAATALATIKGFIPKNWQQVINLVAVGGLCLILGFCKGEDSATAKYEAARSLANVKALVIDGEARDQAGNERVADALRIDRNEEELINAISETPDTSPDTVRIMLGCKRLRAQGTAAADLPPVCGPESGNNR